MTSEPARRPIVGQPTGYGVPATRDSTNLGDILERVLDRGVVIAGDIRVSLLDIELLTIKLRLVVASVDTAREMGIDWWERDPFLAARPRAALPPESQENQEIRESPEGIENREYLENRESLESREEQR